jgi:hypothetical protein
MESGFLNLNENKSSVPRAYIIVSVAVNARDRTARGVARLVGIDGGAVSGMTNLETPGVEVPGWRPHHEECYQQARCQACDLNFEERYGVIGKGFIEAHHLRPIASLKEGMAVSYDVATDFVVLCANCHRMVHRTADPSDLEGVPENAQEHERSAGGSLSRA